MKIITSIVFLLGAGSLLATERYVSADGSYGKDIPGAVCYTGIQEALDACARWDTVWVANDFVCDSGYVDETKYGSGHTRLQIKQDYVTLRGESGNWQTGPLVKGAISGDAEGMMRCITILGSGVTVIGMRFERGEATGSGRGGTAGLWYDFSATVASNCLFAGGKAVNGGGLYGSKQRTYSCVISNCVATSHGNGQYGGSSYDSHFIRNSGDVDGAWMALSDSTVVSNCVFRDNVCKAPSATVCTVTSGQHTFLDCKFYDNVSGSMQSPWQFGCAYGYGTYRHCVFSGNTSYAGGAVASYTSSKKGTLGALTCIDCVFTNNCGTTGNGAAAFYVDLQNCRVERNGGNKTGPLYECRAYNTLIANNLSTEKGGGIYAVKDSQLVNCTVVSNVSRSGSCAYVDSDARLTLVNTILALNKSTAADMVTSATNSFLTVSGVPGTDNIDDVTDPRLQPMGEVREWHPKSGSPCLGTGKVLAWMDDQADVRSRDLDGRPRLTGGRVNIGCYQRMAPAGLAVFLR